MDRKQALEDLKQFLINHELPKNDFALFDIKCPYCGKADRIKPLEPPEELSDAIEYENMETYTALWREFEKAKTVLGVCKFCLNPLELILKQKRAETLYS